MLLWSFVNQEVAKARASRVAMWYGRRADGTIQAGYVEVRAIFPKARRSRERNGSTSLHQARRFGRACVILPCAAPGTKYLSPSDSSEAFTLKLCAFRQACFFFKSQPHAVWHAPTSEARQETYCKCWQSARMISISWSSQKEMRQGRGSDVLLPPPGGRKHCLNVSHLERPAAKHLTRVYGRPNDTRLQASRVLLEHLRYNVSAS